MIDVAAFEQAAEEGARILEDLRMNGAQQRQHRTVTASLDSRLAVLEQLVEALDTRLAALAKCSLDAIDDEREQFKRLAEEQRAYVDGNDRLLNEAFKSLKCRLEDFTTMTFRQRLRWLVTGR